MKSMAFVAYQNRLYTRSKPRRTENPSPRSRNQKFNLRTLFWFGRQPNDIRHVAIDFKSSFWGMDIYILNCHAIKRKKNRKPFIGCDTKEDKRRIHNLIG